MGGTRPQALPGPATIWQMFKSLLIKYQGPMKIKEAKVITHSLSKPNKMPGFSYGLPAWECKTGSKLAKIPGTVCSSCYAMKGSYTMYKGVKPAQYKRLDAIKHPLWVKAMATQINSKKVKYFRWHDAGDIQSVKHLLKIFKVCELSPDVKHWIPTKESQFLKHIPVDRVPKNLIIRISGTKIDGPAPKFWPWSSTVVTKSASCPAPKQSGKCLDCRACWDHKVKNVSYGKH